MKKIIGALLSALFAFSVTSPAFAADRVIIYSGQNPSSTQSNLQIRMNRISFGTWLRDAMGSTTAAGGTYNAISVVPSTGMNVIAQPTTSNQPGSLYQLAQEDPTQVPAGQSTNLPADPTIVMVQALQNSASSNIGPLNAPSTSGQSIYYLIEAQVQTTDTTPASVLFETSTGSTYYQTVNTERQDLIVYQVKTGTAGTSPTVPSVDAGYIGVAKVLVPNGASSISSGMITMLPSFTGFLNSLTAGTGLSIVGSPPTISLSHNDYVDVANTQNSIGGNKTFTGQLTQSNVNPLTVLNSGSNGGLRIGSGSATANGDFAAGLVGGLGQGAPFVGCTGSSQNCTFYVYANGTVSAATHEFNGDGTIEAQSHSGGLTYVVPAYAANGAAVANTVHVTYFTATTASSLSTCGITGGSVYCATINFTGGAAFTSGSSIWWCGLQASNGSTGFWGTGSPAGTVNWNSGSTVYANTNQPSIPIFGFCIGT